VELFRLRWSAFDFGHGAVTVLMGKVGRAKTVFPPAAYLSEAWERFCADGQDKELYVCRNSRGGTVHQYQDLLAQARRKAGIKQFSFYALRHIAATQMIAAGADVAAVAANLGHSSPAITLKHYAHALPQAQKAASEALGAAWCSPTLPEPVKSGS
jgi:integrase